LRTRSKLIIWISIVALSIVLLIIGYSYLYVVFPKGLLEQGVNRLSEVVEEGLKSSKDSSIDLILRLTLTIMANNAIANTLFALPFVGPLFYVYTIVFTGAILRYYVELYTKSIPHEKIMLSLLTTPHTYIEFLAYAIALTESIILTTVIVKTIVNRKHLLGYLAMLCISYAVLFLAAFVEALTMYFFL